ncbi:hypothetical protein N5853_06315 [Bartonella sp. HY329]|uniref:hypothetical protein n=1 Tax=unclassified Bartonella TaxID=2645622 RepID=UPI0021C89AF7|nr:MULTISPECIES: hypothetical protein [unclassified Bartonella]UXM96221.1 hypothetical protein N5853_06315 [Bartonella sp. HY329]UXN10545.1 hypothetical protein N5852_06325 [Bartonella sp. HY328]
MSRLSRFFLFSFLMFSSFQTKAETLENDICKSEIITDGMQVKLYVTAPIVVDKQTNRMIETDFSKKFESTYPLIAVSFTAYDKDIKWQQDFYYESIVLYYKNYKSKKNFITLREEPIWYSEEILKLIALKRGQEKVYYFHFQDVAFDETLNKEKIIIFANGKLMNVHEFKKFTNPFKGDKNVWQEPVKLCLEANWHYQ